MNRLRISLALFACLSLCGTALAGEKYALIVGVEKYIPTELPSLAYAEDDAVALAEALERLGFSVITMTSASDNPRHRSTTAARILEQVASRLEDREPSDTIVLAFSGHGLQFKGDWEFYFCPGEAELGDRSTLVPLGRVLEAVGRCRAGRKLLLVDACRDELEPKAAGKGVAIELDPAGVFRAEPPTGTVALFSCQPREKSYELKQLGHSVFTHHVLEYLSGAAAADRYPRQEVSVEELVPFVRNRTRETAAKELGAPQKPEAIAPDAKIPDWPLGLITNLASVERVPNMRLPSPPALPKAGDVIENSVGMKLVLIPAGEFQMGSEETIEDLEAAITASGIEWPGWNIADEQPAHRLRITQPFRMGAHEVTLGQFLSFYHDGYKGKLDCEKDGANCGGYDAKDAEDPFREKPIYRPWSWGFDGQTNDHPVVNVSWNDAVAFCEWLSQKEGKTYRLPTEAEWEYACRAGSRSRYWNGDDPEKLAEIANVGDRTAKDRFKDWGRHINSRDGYAFTSPVGAYRANTFGLYDMHGNVAEWCSDWHDEKYYATSPSADPAGPDAGSIRVHRGSDWLSGPVFCRSASRNAASPSNRGSNLGFRVVRE
jgi:formylglycine-generating enzyme required for sulfatase activity